MGNSEVMIEVIVEYGVSRVRTSVDVGTTYYPRVVGGLQNMIIT
jgi:hypothetical protein